MQLMCTIDKNPRFLPSPTPWLFVKMLRALSREKVAGRYPLRDRKERRKRKDRKTESGRGERHQELLGDFCPSFFFRFFFWFFSFLFFWCPKKLGRMREWTEGKSEKYLGNMSQITKVPLINFPPRCDLVYNSRHYQIFASVVLVSIVGK